MRIGVRIWRYLNTNKFPSPSTLTFDKNEKYFAFLLPSQCLQIFTVWCLVLCLFYIVNITLIDHYIIVCSKDCKLSVQVNHKPYFSVISFGNFISSKEIMDLKLKLLNIIVFGVFIGGTLHWICSTIIYHCIWKTPDHRKSKFQKLSLNNNPRDYIKLEINSLQMFHQQ